MSLYNEERLNCLVDILQPDRKTRILDVGAKPLHGCPYWNLLASGHAEVWGFEPQPSGFEQLKDRISENEHYFPYAVGDGQPATLNVYQTHGFTSLLEPNQDTLKFLNRFQKSMTLEQQIELTTKRLDDIDDLPKPDFVKIDVQGSEKTIFENGPNKMSDCCAVMTEACFIPIYKNQPLFHEQAAVLHDYGMLFAKFTFLKYFAHSSRFMDEVDWQRAKSQPLDGDAIFYRDLTQPDTITDDQLKHMAILSDSVLETFDLGLKCLDMLIERGAVSEADCRRYSQLVPFQKSNR